MIKNNTWIYSIHVNNAVEFLHELSEDKDIEYEILNVIPHPNGRDLAFFINSSNGKEMLNKRYEKHLSYQEALARYEHGNY